ncbi:MAG: response regulator transcription factor [Planctomycetes bacterium]|nr:response regulator transcription factor [Planctomycetota bacterium]
MIRILIASDYRLVLEAQRLQIDAEPDMTVVAEAIRGEDAVAEAEKHCPDIALIDVSIPGLTCHDTLQRIHAKVPGTRSIVLDGVLDPVLLARVIRSGASGFVAKDWGFERVRSAIREVAAGEFYFPPEVLRALPTDIKQLRAGVPVENRMGRLTARERELLVLLAQGEGLKMAAHMLGVSYKTADKQKESLMKKLDIHDRVALARFAIRERIVQA